RSSSERLQVLDEFGLLLRAQSQVEALIVVIDHVAVGREAAVVVEASLLLCEEALERRRSVELLVRRTAGLEVVDADLLGRVHVPPRLGEERGDVAGGGPVLAFETGVPGARPGVLG